MPGLAPERPAVSKLAWDYQTALIIFPQSALCTSTLNGEF